MTTFVMITAFGFHPPPIGLNPMVMKDPIPNIIALPYGKCPPMHIQAPTWRHLLKLMAQLSSTRIEPALEAMAITKQALKLRTVIQFVRVSVLFRQLFDLLRGPQRRRLVLRSMTRCGMLIFGPCPCFIPCLIDPSILLRLAHHPLPHHRPRPTPHPPTRLQIHKRRHLHPPLLLHTLLSPRPPPRRRLCPFQNLHHPPHQHHPAPLPTHQPPLHGELPPQRSGRCETQSGRQFERAEEAREDGRGVLSAG